MEVGFCDCDLRGFSLQQPTCQHDRWDLPVSNGTHLLITWRPDRRLCGMNVSSYFLDVRTSTPLVNFFMGIFGAFPQDMCDPRGSKARDAVHAADARGRTCSTYPRRCDFGRQTSFELPPALKKVVQTGVQVSTMAYGTISPPGDPAVRSNVTFWCHVYRWRAQGRPRSPPAPSQARWGVGHSTVRVGLQRRGGGELDSSNAMSSAYEEHVRQKAALEPVVLGVSILVFLAARTLRRTFRKVPSAGNSRSTDAAAASGTAWGSLPVLALVEATLPLLVFVVAPFTFVLLARDSSTKDLGLPDPQGAIWNILIPSGNIALIQACCTILLCPSCIEAHGFAEKLLGEHINITPQVYGFLVAFHCLYLVVTCSPSHAPIFHIRS
ncbi:hypothetical protein AB1Y20_009006 [Prymnesium parvum]|uniref:Uncharacterized protein n=1 Tax=Prymnesium parvum TaxID=97485 RepID=A0AB34K4F9_PRYPA